MKALSSIILFSLLLAVGCGTQKKEQPKVDQTPKETPKEVVPEANVKLPGIAPVDVYGNLEQRGFKVEKSFTEFGNSWQCKSSEAGVDYTVGLFSSSATDVETISATAMLDVTSKKPTACLPFLKFVASAPISGVDIPKVQAWIEKNLNKDKESMEVGDVRYTIFAPSKAVRMLTVVHKSVQR